MRYNLFSLKSKFLSLTIGLFLIFMPFVGSYAAAGCCSHHGGVSGCDKSTNHESCKDGSVSPSCLCNGGKTTATKPTTSSSSKSKTSSTTSTAASTTAASTTATTTNKPKTTGCCSKHGGIAKCDKKTGYQVCKDGTPSLTCKC